MSAWSTHITGTSRAFSFQELVDGNWQFQVRANTTGVGSSGWRGTASVTVEHTPPTPTISSPMTDMDGSFTVSWSTSTGMVKNHKLQESTLSSTWSSWITYNVTGTSKAFFKPSGNYRYRVQACKTFACSAYSAITYTEVGYGGGGGCLNSGSTEGIESTESSSTQSAPLDEGSSTVTSKEDDGSLTTQALPGPGC